MADMSPSLIPLWRWAGSIGRPALKVLLAVRTAHGKEDPARRRERFGHASLPRREGPLVWVHAASVGEITAALPLVGALTARGYQVLATTVTVTSARIAADRLPAGAFHQFVPLDVAPYVTRFLNHWRPQAALFVESEIWPATIDELRRRDIPRIVVNGRLSARSHAGWRRWRQTARGLFGALSACLAQTNADGQRFADLGVGEVYVSGNLKFDVAPPPVDDAELRRFEEMLGNRPRWVAASTHGGEEDLVAVAHARLAARRGDLVTFVVPRHPERGPAIAERLDPSGSGVSVALRSRGDRITPDTRFYVADSIGEIGLFYKLSPIAFMGGSLVANGGHNPIEPIRLGAAVVVGPHVANFRTIYADLAAAGGLTSVEDGEMLARAVATLMDDPSQAEATVALATAVLDEHAGSVGRTLRVIDRFLPAPPAAGPAAETAS